jgi:hypothetical protein
MIQSDTKSLIKYPRIIVEVDEAVLKFQDENGKDRTVPLSEGALWNIGQDAYAAIRRVRGK